MDRPTSAERREKLVELHKQGLDGGEIGRVLGITRQRVHQLRSYLGLSVVDTVPARRRTVANMIAAGRHPREIARVVECSRDVLYRDAVALGLVEQLRANRKRGPAGA